MSKKLLHLCVLACLFFLTACQSSPKPKGFPAQVERVVSGHAMEIRRPNLDAIQRVRLIGIEAPDLDQEPWGITARDRLEQLVSDATILLESDVAEKDGANRRLAYCWRDGVLLNEQLVAEGLALAMVRSPNFKYDQRFAQAQEKARALGLGIWNPDRPMRQTPAEFRKQFR